MEITMTNQTPINGTTPSMASGFAMPVCGQVSFGSVVERIASIPATGLSLWTTEGTDVRDRKDQVETKGHVAIAAYLPGNPAWSPPIC